MAAAAGCRPTARAGGQGAAGSEGGSEVDRAGYAARAHLDHSPDWACPGPHAHRSTPTRDVAAGTGAGVVRGTPGVDEESWTYAGFCSRVPVVGLPGATIFLGRRLPDASRGPPGGDVDGPPAPPAWPCSRWGMPSRDGHPPRWWSLTPPFHPCHVPWGPWRSALCCACHASLRLGVAQHRALWSPDVPRPGIPKDPTRGRLTNSPRTAQCRSPRPPPTPPAAVAGPPPRSSGQPTVAGRAHRTDRPPMAGRCHDRSGLPWTHSAIPSSPSPERIHAAA